MEVQNGSLQLVLRVPLEWQSQLPYRVAGSFGCLKSFSQVTSSSTSSEKVTFTRQRPFGETRKKVNTQEGTEADRPVVQSAVSPE